MWQAHCEVSPRHKKGPANAEPRLRRSVLLLEEEAELAALVGFQVENVLDGLAGGV